MSTYVQTRRLDANRVKVETDNGLDIILFANSDVSIDRQSLRETRGIAQIADTIDNLRQSGFLPDDARLRRAVLTPDFHKGSGIPVGTVLDARGFIIPKCIGRDINCSMRFLTTDVTVEEFQALGKELDARLRHIFFAGGRDLPMTEELRRRIMRHGLPGLDRHGMNLGLWRSIPDDIAEREFDKTNHGGSWETDDEWMFSDFIRGAGGLSRDSAIGSIGGGNHFVEFQAIDRLEDRKAAWRWGIKEGHVSIMIHSGSLFAGGMVGDHFMEKARAIYPSSLKRPDHDFYPIPLDGEHAALARSYLSALGLASNLAVINRLVMGFMAVAALSDCLGRRVEHAMLADVSHNMAWVENDGSVLHRKGASPAGLDNRSGFPDGIPVILPGSMGDYSYVLKGCGLDDALHSAPHGAGRIRTRGAIRKGGEAELDSIRIVTKIDPRMERPDIAKELRRNMMEEAPSAYKPVMPALETVRDAGMASPVARVKPLLTVKG